MDGRLEVYGESFFADYFRILQRDWNRFAATNGINIAMIHRGHLKPLVSELQANPEWILVHVDPGEMVFVRDIPEHAELIRTYQIDLSRPWSARGPEPTETMANWRRWMGWVENPWYSLGMAGQFLMLGSIDNSAFYLERALGTAPKHEKARLELAVIRRSQDRDDEAEQLLADMDLSPEQSLWADQMLAALFFRAGQTVKAIAPMERAVRAKPEDAGIHAALAEAYTAVGEHRSAAATYRAALKLSPENSTYWVQLGAACEKLDQPDGAAQAYRNAVRRAPSLYKVNTRLGALLARSGDLSGALECFQNALRVRPDYEPARQFLKRLRIKGAADSP